MAWGPASYFSISARRSAAFTASPLVTTIPAPRALFDQHDQATYVRSCSVDTFLVRGPLAVAQYELLDLTAGGLWQITKLDRARHLEPGQSVADEGAQV